MRERERKRSSWERRQRDRKKERKLDKREATERGRAKAK